MCYVERIIEQLRRRGVVMIVVQATEYYEEYCDYAGQCDFTLTYRIIDGRWVGTNVALGEDSQLANTEAYDSFDDVIDDIIEYVYRDPYSASSIKTYTEDDAIGTDVNF